MSFLYEQLPPRDAQDIAFSPGDIAALKSSTGEERDLLLTDLGKSLGSTVFASYKNDALEPFFDNTSQERTIMICDEFTKLYSELPARDLDAIMNGVNIGIRYELRAETKVAA